MEKELALDDSQGTLPTSLDAPTTTTTQHSRSPIPRNGRPSSPTPSSSSSSLSHPDLELARTKSIAESLSPIHEVLFISLLCSAQFVTQMGLNNTLNILHIIGDDLQITSAGVLAWLIAGYSLTVGTFILISGRCGDVFGYKKMLVLGFEWFAVWNVVAGCSVYCEGNGGKVLFIWARVLQGLGPAVLLPNALGLLGATYKTGRKKDVVFSLFGACAPVGAIVGGTFAGLWSLLWWPWTFWTLGIALAILGLVSIFIIPSIPVSSHVRNLTLRQKIEELDLLGAAVGITAMILFNFAWNQAPGFGWQQPYIYVLLIIGILLVPVFFWVELKVSKSPLIPFDVLSSDVSFVLICICCGWASFGIFIYYFVQFLQLFRYTTPLLTMAQFSPVAISGFLAALTTGHVISRIGPAWVMMISMLAFLLGNILTATMPVHQTYWAQAFVISVVIPWGMDMSFPAGTLIMSDAVEKRHQGMAASLVNTVVNYSVSIGVGIAGTVEIQVMNGGTTKTDQLKGFRAAMWLGVGFAGLGLAASVMFLLKKEMMGRKQSAEKVEEKR